MGVAVVICTCCHVFAVSVVEVEPFTYIAGVSNPVADNVPEEADIYSVSLNFNIDSVFEFGFIQKDTVCTPGAELLTDT